MIKIGTIGVYRGSICIKIVDTIDEAIVVDYIHGWNKGHIQLDIRYKGQLLKRLDDNRSFIEEIGYLKHQISVIDNIRD